MKLSTLTLAGALALSPNTKAENTCIPELESGSVRILCEKILKIKEEEGIPYEDAKQKAINDCDCSKKKKNIHS